ncbi:MAG: tol-pal system protein YbgF [Rhodanobacter sp.]
MMEQLANRFAARMGMAGAIASAMLFAFPVFAQSSRLSLADRVARLEQQTQSKDQSGTGLVNQMQQIQEQLRQQQGMIEELQHHLRQLEDKNKVQYVDLESRVERIEGGTAGASTAAPVGSNPTSAAPAATAGQAGNSVAAPSTAGASAPAAVADPAAMQASYTVAFNALRGGDYVQASRAFRDFIKQYPAQSLTPNAYYWLGESYYVTMNYPVALETFQSLLSQFPQSEKAADALLKVGYSQLELKQVDAAQATLTAVGNRYPGTNAANLAKERLRRIQLQSAN